MPEFENYLEERIEALENAAPSGASGLPNPEDYEAGASLTVAVENVPEAENAFYEVTSSAVTMDGGTWTITFGGDTTDPIDFDADSPTIIAALEALASIGAGNVTTDNTLADPVVGVGFIGDLGGQPISIVLTADGSSLTGDDSPYTFSVEQVEPGSAAGPKTLVWSSD